MQQLPHLCCGDTARQPAVSVQAVMGLPRDYKHGTNKKTSLLCASILNSYFFQSRRLLPISLSTPQKQLRVQEMGRDVSA